MAHLVCALSQRVSGSVLAKIVNAICHLIEQFSELDHEPGTMPNASSELVKIQPSQVIHDSIVAS